MSDTAYTDALHDQFKDLNTSNFTVQFMPPVVFVCGGPMLPVYSSLRERIFAYTAVNDTALHDSLVLAENFKDYFKDGAYTDLMQFEEDIANISTLIVICLESAGSLVELGLFVNRKALAQRLLVIAPAEEIEENVEKGIPARSSFIYLGPLEYLKRLDSDSVAVYPFPKLFSSKYNDIDLVVHDIKKRLESVKKTEKYNGKNTGHLATLVLEVILLSEPIKLSEIEWALLCMEIDVERSVVSRLLYLLEIMNLISFMPYSGTDYYYVKNSSVSKMKFGKTKSGKIQDAPNMKVAIRQSYISLYEDIQDETAKKRRNVLIRINEHRKPEEKE
ncbi:retron St85 family effector protein [Yersinia enterocolitica]|uniref:retron St85 family effector protein n=1 Tax=Yersinia enterocolitica TaxID=630 RepID=UPI00398D55FF